MSTAEQVELEVRPQRQDEVALAWLLLLGGMVGLVASSVLIAEKIALLTDPTYVPSCSVNPVLNCGSVMSTAQAEVFGFPNPILGVAAFPVLVTTGATLLAGGRLAAWYWRGLQVGVTLGLGFVLWLAFQSLYRIGALCPYCMVVWAVVWPTFLYVTLRNLRVGIFGTAIQRSRLNRVLGDWHAPVLLGGYLVVLVLVGVRFWSYWSTLL
ncbi:vitamin K epoxide reductase family protein [Nocardioides caricicola]|uniref:Vitamin K epoxide reductase family protein n=1 Tax=Nocardioides caricicola TaxID=634770 RepID=A0ABW0N3M1_9ACTN